MGIICPKPMVGMGDTPPCSPAPVATALKCYDMYHKKKKVARWKNLVCITQRCNHGGIFGATSAMLGQNLPPPGWNRVMVSENLLHRSPLRLRPWLDMYLLKLISSSFSESKISILQGIY